MTYTASPRKDASTAQKNYIASLAAQRPDTAHLVPLYAQYLSGLKLNSAQASSIIDALQAQPRQPRPAPPPAAPRKQAEPGYYTRGNDVFVVVRNQARTGTYAKQLIVPTNPNRNAFWNYAPGVGAELADLTPLTVDEARRLSHLHGVCVICGTRLTDPKSVERGIGPVCIKKIGPVRVALSVEDVEREMQLMEAAADRADTERDERAKADWKATVETYDQPVLVSA